VAQPGAELETALATYQAVYAQSWKQPEPCLEFIPELVKLAAERGWLRLGVLWLNGEPLAAQLWLTGGGKANIYRLAYIKGVEKLSAGSVLTQALMQHAMDVDRVTEVDYLSGDDAYRANWMALRRKLVGLKRLMCDAWLVGWLAGGGDAAIYNSLAAQIYKTLSSFRKQKRVATPPFQLLKTPKRGQTCFCLRRVAAAKPAKPRPKRASEPGSGTLPKAT
jgi:hypothetical protein